MQREVFVVEKERFDLSDENITKSFVEQVEKELTLGTGREITGGKSEAAGAHQCPGTISGSGSGGCDPCSDGDCTSR